MLTMLVSLEVAPLTRGSGCLQVGSVGSHQPELRRRGQGSLGAIPRLRKERDDELIG